MKAETFTTGKIANLSGAAHVTTKKRLVQGAAVSESNGTYTLKEILSCYERLASGRTSDLDATEAKTKLANLKIEREALGLRKLKGELVEVKPREQYISALVKCLWGEIQNQAFTRDQLDHVRNEINRVTSEFVAQYDMYSIATVEDREQIDAEEANNPHSAEKSDGAVKRS